MAVAIIPGKLIVIERRLPYKVVFLTNVIDASREPDHITHTITAHTTLFDETRINGIDHTLLQTVDEHILSHNQIRTCRTVGMALRQTGTVINGGQRIEIAGTRICTACYRPYVGEFPSDGIAASICIVAYTNEVGGSGSKPAFDLCLRSAAIAVIIEENCTGIVLARAVGTTSFV